MREDRGDPQGATLDLPQAFRLKLGLILNFNVPVMKEGIVRLVNELKE
jgi:hypothetical protein